MSEEKTQQPSANVNEGDKSSAVNPIDRADSVVKRLEEANKKHEELLNRQEQLEAKRMLAGNTQAGSVQKTPDEIQKEKVQEQVNKLMFPKK